MTDDDKANLKDLAMAARALEEAADGIKADNQQGRDMFAWGVGFALSRLSRVRARFHPQPKATEEAK